MTDSSEFAALLKHLSKDDLLKYLYFLRGLKEAENDDK